MGELHERLRADGLELREDPTPKPGAYRRGYQLVPTDPSPVPLASETTALESELAARGYNVALNHYRHAVDGLVNKKYESANGTCGPPSRTSSRASPRTRLATSAPWTRQPDSRELTGGAAVKHLLDGGHIPEKDGGKLLQGLWDMTHTNGLTRANSTLKKPVFRMQVVTAVTRFLLRRFPPKH